MKTIQVLLTFVFALTSLSSIAANARQVTGADLYSFKRAALDALEKTQCNSDRVSFEIKGISDDLRSWSNILETAPAGNIVTSQSAEVSDGAQPLLIFSSTSDEGQLLIRIVITSPASNYTEIQGLDEEVYVYEKSIVNHSMQNPVLQYGPVLKARLHCDPNSPSDSRWSKIK